MKILLTVEFYNPDKGGAQKVVEDLARELVERGHDVMVATTHVSERKSSVIDGVKIDSFKIGGNATSGIKGDKREIQRYQDLVTKGDFDVVFNYAAQSWHTDLIFPLLERINAVKVLAPVGYSRLMSPKYKMYFNTLPVYLSRYDKLVYHSPNYRDKIYGDVNDLSDKKVIISNGALKKEFRAGDTINVRKKLGVKTRYLIITVSHHNFAKGHRFAIRAFKKMRREDATLVIVGDRLTSQGVRRIAHFILDYLYCFFSSLFSKKIILVNDKDLRSLYKSADLQMNGSMLECAPLIMYESFASETPFVTTDVGNVRDHIDNLLVADDPSEMAKMANGILDDESKRKSLTESGVKLWRENHITEELAGLYEKLFKGLIDARS